VSMDKQITHLETHDWLLGDNATTELEQTHSADRLVHADMPPTLIIACEDDDLVPVENSIRYFNALQANGVKADMHLVPHGGHGWGFSTDTPEPEKVYHYLEQFLNNVFVQ